MKMKKNKLFYLLIIPLFSIAFLSCSDNNDNSYKEWRAENEAYIADIKEQATNSTSVSEVFLDGGPGSIYREIIKSSESENGIFPLYTDQVDVRYKGELINGTVFDDASERIVSFNVNGVVKGFTIALQKMQVGDKWKVYIPWELGYGYAGSGSKVPPYSALIFEIELLGFN